jgi:hypothetical protein
LDPKALENAFQAGELGAGVADRLMPYLSTEKRWTVRLKEKESDET